MVVVDTPLEGPLSTVVCVEDLSQWESVSPLQPDGTRWNFTGGSQKSPLTTSARNRGSCFLSELLSPRVTRQMRTDGCRAGEPAQITVVQFFPS